MRRVLLVGFMASGKTTVGRAVARRLGWDFIDIDAAVEAREGRSVAQIFDLDGEERFRRLEAEETARALTREDVVVAPGGGWAVQDEERLEEVPEGTLTVWLRVDPATAVGRARASRAVRPLLAGPEPLEAASALSAERARFYARARLHLDTTDVAPTALTDAVVHAVGGAPDRS